MATPMTSPDPTSVVGRRVVAAILDGLLLIVPAILILTSSFEYLEVDDLSVSGEEFCEQYLDDIGGACVNAEDIDERVYYSEGSDPAGGFVYWGGSFLLLVVLQAFTGWTPGKLIVGLRVVREDGRPPGFVKALLRWIALFADLFPYFIPGLTGFIVALTTPGHRRLGDMLARTFVVKRAAAGTPISLGDGNQLVVGTPVAAPSAAWAAPAPAPGAPAGWGPAVDPSASGWASPSEPAASTPAATPAPAADGPQWDEARGTYIQWDPTQGAWMQWDEGSKSWTRMPGQ